MSHLIPYAMACGAGALGTALSTPWWRRWCVRRGVVDDPGHRKIHATPIPLAGGPAVLTGLLAALLGGVLLGALGSRATWVGPFEYGLGRRAWQLAGITAGAVIMLLTGFRDDRAELKPAAKFGGQLLAALVVAAGGVRVTLFVHNLPFSYGITVLWILTVVNAFNFMDNMNGLCTGLGIIAGFCFGCVAAALSQYLVAAISFAVVGALAGFLPYNFPRAGAFLGDSGSHLTGYLMAVLGILPHFFTPKHSRELAVLTPLLVLAVPLGDLAWVVMIRTKAGRPFYIGDTNHLSHRLVARGFSPAKAVLMIWAWAAAFGAAGYWWE